VKKQSILVTGSNGQLGFELQKLAANYPYRDFIFTDKDQLDITKKQDLKDFFASHQIDFVINCAGYTQVDKAEENQKEAEVLNAEAPKLLAELCNQAGALLVHVSTDYVFDGNASEPYRESDTPSPINYYGRTKLQGDNFIQEIANRVVIFRTSWLYSSHGHNFVKTILRKARSGENLKVVNDQIGTPTYAADLASVIFQVMDKLPAGRINQLYNFSNFGEASWFEFATEILKIKQVDCDISPAKTSDFSFPAARPKYSVLDKTLIIKDFNLEIPYWKDSLARCLMNV